MIYYVITQAHKNPDPAAARAIVQAGTDVTDEGSVELSEYAEDFIEGMEKVFAGTSDEAKEIRLMGVVPAWVVTSTEGSGDEWCEWMSDFPHVVTEYPGLLAALGVHIDASSGFYTGHKTFHEPMGS